MTCTSSTCGRLGGWLTLNSTFVRPPGFASGALSDAPIARSTLSMPSASAFMAYPGDCRMVTACPSSPLWRDTAGLIMLIAPTGSGPLCRGLKSCAFARDPPSSAIASSTLPFDNGTFCRANS